MHAPIRRHNWILLAFVASTGIAGCKDQEKCNEALETARKAMQDQYLDMGSAREWREHAGKVCGAGPEIQALDQQILAKEAEIAKAAQENAEKEAENGKKAMEASAKLWKKFDSLKEDDRDQKALKSYFSKTKKITKEGLADEYKKQVDGYNAKQYKARKQKLED